MYIPVILVTCMLFFTACGSKTKEAPVWQIIAGRENGSFERLPLYRAQVPKHWKRVDPTGSIIDTKKPLCEWELEKNGETIRIAVHNFPTDTIETRIPPQAQVMRWKGQFEELEPASVLSETFTHGGFVGLFFEGTGVLKGKPQTVIGWAMQLAALYYPKVEDRQVRADYTIKGVGDPEMIAMYRKEIVAFARSFELINELPPTF